ncbi:MAG TPA: helix-turn-helix transcriptional regulator [Solirubrobacterales bacterium]|nr:helix-turn-helix transcriptional regulator [Solirubrobacterales bacterium]
MPDPEILAAFGKRVRALRLGKEWTQEQLADKAGLNLGQISRIERGVREVRLTTVLTLIVALEVTPDDLLGDL